MTILLLCLVPLGLPGCAAVPFGLGLIPGAPSYVSSLIGNGQTVYETAVDERTTRQQMLDAIIAGHAQAELYKNKEIRPNQITTHCYFGKVYLVGEYDDQEQLRTIYKCMETVKDKRGIINRLYLKDTEHKTDFLSNQTTMTELKAQLLADFKVTSSPVKVEIVHDDIILLGVISDKTERDRIMAHALNSVQQGRVVSYLYHQENAGPQPRIMSAGLPSLNTAAAPSPPEKGPQRHTIKDIPHTIASATPTVPLVVNGRISGL